jgi:hypothetical protein
MAIGALLTWYLIADATILTEGPYAAAEIANQALDVANNPKIDNFFFAVIFRIVLAKTSIATSDLESAKVHISQAADIAKKFGMNDLLSRIYLLYGKYFQEMGLTQSPEQKKYLEGSKKMYELAENLIKQTKNTHVHVELEQAKSVLNSFANVNGIIL